MPDILKLLEKLEWSGPYGCCPECLRGRPDVTDVDDPGHRMDCQLRQAIDFLGSGVTPIPPETPP